MRQEKYQDHHSLLNQTLSIVVCLMKCLSWSEIKCSI